MDARAAHADVLLDHQRAPPGLRGLDRRLLTGRTRTNDDDIPGPIGFHATAWSVSAKSLRRATMAASSSG
jgi:hypothetical protein